MLTRIPAINRMPTTFRNLFDEALLMSRTSGRMKIAASPQALSGKSATLKNLGNISAIRKKIANSEALVRISAWFIIVTIVFFSEGSFSARITRNKIERIVIGPA